MSLRRVATLTSRACSVLAVLLGIRMADAQEVLASAPSDVAVTLYRAPLRAGGSLELNRLGGFALVSETRLVNLPAGLIRLRFAGVLEGIQASSAVISGLPQGVLEKNRDASVLSPSSLVAANLGHRLLLVRTDRKTGRPSRVAGTLLSDADGGLLFETADGVEALHCSGLPETFSFEADAKLGATPTLSALVRNPTPLTTTVTLTYLAAGFDWNASYVATLSADARSMELGAWVTLANGNGISLPNAHAQVVAGRLNRESGEVEPVNPGHALLAHCWPMGSTSDLPPPQHIERAHPLLPGEYDLLVEVKAARMSAAFDAVAPAAAPLVAELVQEEQLGDLKLYRVPERTTVASRQMKQVRLLDRHEIPIETYYAGEVDANQNRVLSPGRRMLRTRNDGRHALGLPLPAGEVASFARRGQESVLLSQAPLRDVAVDEELEWSLGESSEVEFQSVHENVRQSGVQELPRVPGVLQLRSAEIDDVTRVQVTNAGNAAIVFELTILLPEAMQLIAADAVPLMKHGHPVLRVRVPANGETTLRYQTEHDLRLGVPRR